jgi:hypothetical protein
MRRHLVRFLVVLSVAGCGSSSSGSNPDASAGEAAVTPETQSALPFCTAKPSLASVTDLSGTWVARVAGSQIVAAQVVGAVQTQSLSYLLLTITQRGSELVADGRYCDRATINPAKTSNLASVVIPDAWAHTETPVRRSGTFSARPDGVRILALPPVTEIVGAVLAAPGDPLPTKIDDATVIDQDGDGIPGITIVVSGIVNGSLYAVQEQVTSFSAIAVAADRVEGVLAYASNQNVLASDPPSLAQYYAGATSPDPEVCNSSFVMVKIADATAVDGGAVDGGAVDGGGAVNCAWVRANEMALFP